MSTDCFYFRPQKNCTVEYKIKKSLFIGNIFFVQNQDQARNKILEVSKQHKKATHNCWAFRTEYPEKVEAFSDDGEPSGTAGAPIMGVISKNQLDFTLIIVTRYFGGTKLGIRGLIDAYRTASELALEEAGIIKAFPTRNLKIQTDYQNLSHVNYTLKSVILDNTASNQVFDVTVTITYPVLLNRVEEAVQLAEMLLNTQKIFEYEWVS